MATKSLTLMCWCTVIIGCSGDESSPLEEGACPPPARVIGEQCLQPGVADDGCPAGTMLAEDGCRAAGIGAEDCAPGFIHNGDVGCAPVLPSERCPPGLMAVPGDMACRPVMACGQGTWGDIPLEPNAQHVDASYAGTDSDGSIAKPWTTIGEAYDAAVPGTMIAVAEGSYLEDVVVIGKPARLWAVCPERVEIVGSGAELAALVIGPQADGSEVHGFALRGATVGFTMSGALDVVFDRLWVHDTGSRGIDVESTAGAASIQISDSLIEQSHEFGVFVSGSEATIEGTMVRGTLPLPNQTFGRGISIQLHCTQAGCNAAARSNATVSGSLVEANHDIGLAVMGADATIAGSVVRDTLPRALDQTYGAGIALQLQCTAGICDPATRTNATVSGSLVENNHLVGVAITGSDATVDTTVVRGTLPQASDQLGGRGIVIQSTCSDTECDPTTRSVGSVKSSLVEYNHDVGLAISGANGSVEGTVVRGTQPRALDQLIARGIGISLACSQTNCFADQRADATIVGSLVDGNYGVGISVTGSDAAITTTTTRGTLTLPNGNGGFGMAFAVACNVISCYPDTSANVALGESLVEQSFQFGVHLGGAHTSMRNTLIRGTQKRLIDGFFGDGISVAAYEAPASADIASTLIEGSGRAGVASFGASVSLENTHIRCCALELVSEPFGGQPSAFDNKSGNGCGCPAAENECKSVAGVPAPPGPIPVQ